ncbi:MAG TPA: SNF2-related protein [Opitutaceae bacterium]
MSTAATDLPEIRVNDRVRVVGRYASGVGEVLRVQQSGGMVIADVVFDSQGGRRLETLPISRLERATSPWDRLRAGHYDDARDFLLRQLAWQFALGNSDDELSNARTALLPHQILLTHDLIKMQRRRLLMADDVGLGKTIETGMVIRELIARGETRRVLVIAPAGLVKNWQRELRDCFRLEFEILGIDFHDYAPTSWENHHRVIASIDTLKRPQRMERLLAAPKWDLIVFDEAHHLTRLRYGTKIQTTLNYRLAEAVRGHTRDLLFLSATPHQGDAFQFWSLIHLLDDQLFDSPEALENHRGLLNRVIIRRTKREVTDGDGRPLFVRRQVTTERFEPALREQRFYEKLTTYLRDGYDVAGVGQSTRQSRDQRAIGFVMTAFQKMMSSSPRAIRQVLRRRLIVLLVRQQIDLERQRKAQPTPDLADRVLRLQDEMRALAKEIYALASSPATDAQADTCIAQVRERTLKKLIEAEDETNWSLDSDEEGDEGIYGDAEIPDETVKVRELLRLVPDGVDRKFEKLETIIGKLRHENPSERFVIFTQYRETLEFLKTELGRIVGPELVVSIKGGPLDDKIAAAEKFWEENGARILISTSAGCEGINLQIARILFNYDLPWNPMAVEQRIGRIHRFGQKEVSQVYNLVAKDTVEENIYTLLWNKLDQIAKAIGKTDPETGEPLEDFRTDILGFLGSTPNYQQLFKQALIDRDYSRTSRELDRMMLTAQKARTALQDLSQDLTHFNLEQYRRISGQFHLKQLGEWCREAVVRLGGGAVPNGEFWQIITPEKLQGFSNVGARYDRVTFDRELATRTRGSELFGIGHPFVDALIRYLQTPPFSAEVACLPGEISGSIVEARYRVTWDRTDKGVFSSIVIVGVNGTARVEEVSRDPGRFSRPPPAACPVVEPDVEQRAEETLNLWISSRRTEFAHGTIPRWELLGVSVHA